MRAAVSGGRSKVTVGNRRMARERAVCLLYEAEAKDMTPAELLSELPAPPDPFAVTLVKGVGENMGRIDLLLAGRAIGWSLGRMPAVDRNILRVGAFELLECPDVPTAVVISEAVELAKQYSTEESGRWANGVLAGVAGDVRPAEGLSPDNEEPEGYAGGGPGEPPVRHPGGADTHDRHAQIPRRQEDA